MIHVSRGLTSELGPFLNGRLTWGVEEFGGHNAHIGRARFCATEKKLARYPVMPAEIRQRLWDLAATPEIFELDRRKVALVHLQLARDKDLMVLDVAFGVVAED